MTSITDPEILGGHLERINTRARSARPGPVLVAVLVALAMSIGWVLAKILGLAWFTVAWLCGAFYEGWVTGWDSRPKVGGPPG